MKRRVFLTLLIAMAGVFTVSAQERTINAIDWVPAEYAGFVQLRIDLPETLNALVTASQVASQLQPGRVTVSDGNSFDPYFPLINLFDIDDASFDQDIFPWIGDEAVLAYRQFGDNFSVAREDGLLILPTESAFQSASYLSRVLQEQDTRAEMIYHDTLVYVVDKSTIAFTSDAVLLGPQDMVEAALDVQAGERLGIADDAAFQAVRTAAPEDSLVFAYMTGAESMRALGTLLSSEGPPEALLTALGETVQVLQGEDAILSPLLRSELDGIGLSIQPNRIGDMVEATLTLYADGLSEPGTAEGVDRKLLEFVPRRAMAVFNGSDASAAVYNVLSFLPLTNFAGDLFSGFGVPASAALQLDAIAEPGAGDVRLAVTGFLTVLDEIGGINLERDILEHLSGDYVVMLLPRPNNPNPLLRTPYDVLIAAEVDDAEATQAAVSQLIRLVTGVDALSEALVDDMPFEALVLAATEEPMIHLGMVDDVLVFSTGDALEQALAARDGDNQLINQERWQTLSEEGAPQIYLDLNALFSIFFPTPGGPGRQLVGQIGVTSGYAGADVFQVEFQAAFN